MLEILKYQDTCIIVIVFHIMSSSWLLTTAMAANFTVPIIKNKSDDLSDISNYRPIALPTNIITSKMFESVLLFKCKEYLSTFANQLV